MQPLMDYRFSDQCQVPSKSNFFKNSSNLQKPELPFQGPAVIHISILQQAYIDNRRIIKNTDDHKS